MRLTSEVILASESYLNAFNDREITFRGRKIPAIENLAILQDGYDVIDFCDNDIKKIDNFPTMKRLSTLLFHNNSISRIHPQLGKYLPNLTALMLNNNKLQHYYEIEHLANFPKLQLLSLLENPVSLRPYYREFTIYKLPGLKMLDFQKISEKEKKAIKNFFETNASGKQFLQQVEQEKQLYYQQLQQRQAQTQQAFTAAATGTTSAKPAASTAKPGQLVLTEEQKRQVKEAIERATTKEEIELIEHQLKTGTFVFRSPESSTSTNHLKENGSSHHGSSSQSDEAVKERTSSKKPLNSEDYADMDVID